MPQSPNDPNMPPAGGFNPEDRTPREVYQTQTPGGTAAGGKSSKSWGWILGVVAVVLIGVLVICCGILYWGFQAGAEQLTSQVRADVADHPAVQEHIGEIESLDVSFQKTAELGEQGRMVLTVEGSKGEGVIIGSQEPGGQRLSHLVLQTPDGEEYPLEE